ncbi:MAG: PadR family transcriptional regulator [Acidobacteria bacterium]|nr:PadR family transcriptional regulator [Acidobacteriota bacterium]
MSKEDLQLLRGTLDMLMLKALADGDLHGYGVVAWIRERTNGQLEIEEGALYTALHRMEGRRWLRSRWGISENNRRAKYYRITAAGRRQLDQEDARWRSYASAVFDVMGSPGE